MKEKRFPRARQTKIVASVSRPTLEIPHRHCHYKPHKWKDRHSLMLLCLLFDIPDLLRELLEGIFEIRVLELKLYTA
jgi:hypothetical protein